MRSKIVGYSRLFVAIFVLFAIVKQLQFGFDSNPNFSLVNFFSFFTIESNVFGAVMFIVAGLLLLRGKSSQKVDLSRGASTLYMAITGITYFLLLRGLEDQLQTPIPWINITLHYAFPIVIVVDWLFTKRAQITFKQTLPWLIFPLLYLVYSLVRGPIANWYPYPFLKPVDGNYSHVIVVSIGIFAVALIFSWLFSRKPFVKS